jgi:excinuclease ABC subunit B
VIDPIKAAREIKKIEKEMYALARDLKFEEAAKLRDRLRRLQGKSF